MKIIDLLTNSAASQPHKVAIKSDGVQLLYRQVLLDVENLSEYLKSAGCRPGVKVAIVLGNSIEYLVSFFAISAANGTILPLSARMTTYETLKYVNEADVSIVITSWIYAKRLLGKLDSSTKITIVCIQYDSNEKIGIKTIISGNCRADDKNEDVALMVYTSGTTGLPKCVMLTDCQLISNMIAYRSLMRFDSHNIVYCALSLRHIYCISAQLLTHISLADTFIINSNPFFIKDFLKAVESSKVTITAFVPYMAMLLAEFPEPESFDLKSLRYITLAGDKTPKSTYELLTERYPHVQFINTYGTSEAGPRISIAAPFPGRFPVESAGRPMPGVEVRIVADDGNVLPQGATGEIVVKSPGVMKGYYKQPGLTEETIVGNWLKTGDIGKIDDKSNLFLVGRKKDIIISGGENIYPVEIEQCLLEHPAVREVAVVSQRDGRLQEVPCAFIVTKTLKRPAPTEIVSFCRERLSSNKVPRTVKFLDKLPRLSTSKINRNMLKQMADKLP
jgi:long-chain acyl-CoA synthetase